VKTRALRVEKVHGPARSVLECGSPLPLSNQGHPRRQSARGLAHSKTWPNIVALLAVLGAGLGAGAQDYSINWYKVAGGGGTSTGGVYSISATIGQHDASGPLAGGNYSLAGGFWSVISVVQAPGLPNLVISLSGHSVIVSWPNTASCTLQQSSDLAAGSWVTSGYTITTLNGTNSISIPSPTGKVFFRLK
jgi:hypothetical protein